MPRIPGRLDAGLASGVLAKAEYIQGGYKVFATIADRDLYTSNYVEFSDSVLVEGTPVYVVENSTGYRWNGTNWVENGTEGSPIVIKGYYYSNTFWSNAQHTILLTRYYNKLYIDIPTQQVYYYDGNQFELCVPLADEVKAGLVKLYDDVGNNRDGTMTQNSITTNLNKKCEIDEDVVDECLSFKINL